jgi:hypothetical protein
VSAYKDEKPVNAIAICHPSKKTTYYDKCRWKDDAPTAGFWTPWVSKSVITRLVPLTPKTKDVDGLVF